MKKIKANLNTRTRWDYAGTPGNYRRVKTIVHRWSLPADPASYDKMVKQVARSIHRPLDGIDAVERAVEALASIGITRPE